MNKPLSNIDRAIAAWSVTMPDWVRALAEACDEKGMRGVSRLIGYSLSPLSDVLRRDYRGNYDNVAAAVRAKIMPAVSITGGANLTAACQAWGNPPPDWIIALAQACDERGQGNVAAEIGYSGGAISSVINRRYKASYDSVEFAARGALMGVTVGCPVMGDLAAHECLDWQRKPWASTNDHRMRMFRACRNNCPHSRIQTKGGANGL